MFFLIFILYFARAYTRSSRSSNSFDLFYAYFIDYSKSL